MHQDLTPGVMAGLAWYYLLAALLNAAAAAYVSYGEMVSEGASRVGLAPKTQAAARLADRRLLRLYGLAILMILVRDALPEAVKIAYSLCARPTRLARHCRRGRRGPLRGTEGGRARRRVDSRGPSLDDHIPAVGLGRPINRTLWTLIWGVAAVIFQAMGMSYLLGGDDHPAPVRPRRHRLCLRPDHLLRGRDDRLHRRDSLPPVPLERPGSLVGVNLFLLYFGLSMTDFDFRDIVTKPDNVPIVGLLVLVGYFTWLCAPPRRDQRRPDGRRACPTWNSSSPRRP